MQIISFLMSMIMAVTSLFAPAQAVMQQEMSEKAQIVDKAISLLFSNTTGFFEEETNEIVEAIAKNILIEAFTNESESEDLVAIAEKIPIYENGVRDKDCQNVTVGPLKKAFGDVMSTLIESTFVSGIIKDFLVLLADGVYELYFYLVPAEEEGLYIFYCDYVDNNGDVIVKNTGTCYDKNTGRVYGLDGKGMLGIGFDYEIGNYLVTTPVYAWQRTFGYSVFYDFLGEMGFMKTDTVRVKFEHGGKHWMFQLWKGNYTFGLTNGAEIGIYNKENKYSLTYDCASDEEMLDMSMKVLYDNEVVVEREETRHWWICGLRFGTPVPPEELLFNGTIEFEDAEMMAKFMEAAKEYSDEMTVSAEENKVTITWQ